MAQQFIMCLALGRAKLQRVKLHKRMRQNNMVFELCEAFCIKEEKDHFTICDVILPTVDQLDGKCSCVHLCMHVYIHVHDRHVCIYACMCTCSCVRPCMHVYMFMCASMHACVHVHDRHVCIYACMCTCSCVRPCMHVYMFMCASMHACVHVHDRHVCIYACMCTCSCVQIW